MPTLPLPSWYNPGPQGQIILPASEASSPTEVRIPKPEIPRQLQLDLEANAHLEPHFYGAVGAALTAALRDPATRPRQLTEATLKEWAELCYRVILIMRYDLNFALKRCFDILPDEFVEALKAGVRIEDMVERHQKGMWWKRSGAEEEKLLVKRELNDDQQTERQKEEVAAAEEAGVRLHQEIGDAG